MHAPALEQTRSPSHSPQLPPHASSPQTFPSHCGVHEPLLVEVGPDDVDAELVGPHTVEDDEEEGDDVSPPAPSSPPVPWFDEPPCADPCVELAPPSPEELAPPSSPHAARGARTIATVDSLKNEACMAGQHATSEPLETPAKGGVAETKHYLVADAAT